MTGFLASTNHRPWPMPQRPWIWRQRWDSVLLLHYRAPAATLRPFVPEQLAIEEHSGSAWVSVVPFRMLRVRPRGAPPLPWISDFPELNVRTYVRHGGRSGVFFLLIEAGKRAAAWLARRLSPLPYAYAPIAWRTHAAGVSVESPGLAVDFAAESSSAHASDSLDQFLTERYCLFAGDRGNLRRADVHHAPWPLCSPRVRVTRNRLLAALNVARPLHPDRCHFSPGVEIVGWPSERING